MATTRAVLDSIRGEVMTAIDGIKVGGKVVAVGVGWPPSSAIMEAMKAKNGLISVYDRSGARDVTRWAPQVVCEETVVSLLTSTIGGGSSPIPVGASRTITLGGTVKANDAVGVNLVKNLSRSGQVAVASAGNTLAQVATALAAAINTDPVTGTWVSAAAVGAVVTLTNLLQVAIHITTGVANLTTQLIEYKRSKRTVQVVSWMPSEVDRQAIGDPIDARLAKVKSQFGTTLTTGEVIRVEYAGDRYIEEEQMRDCYRRDFMMDCEYGVSVEEAAYSVLITDVIVTVQVDQTDVVIIA